MADSQDFYRNLTPVGDFLAISEARKYEALPKDWYIVITDVVNSTEAIENGKYKDVNTAGGLAAMAVANALGNLDFPFVFGGDGVTMLLHHSHLPVARDVLASTRTLCKEMFALDLRVGFVPMSLLTEVGHELKVLKLGESEALYQAMLIGSGLEAAEALVKSPSQGQEFLLPTNYIPQQEADFSGFVCNWLDILSPKGETVSLIVKTLNQPNNGTEPCLRDILREIWRICGSEAEHHPLSVQNLAVTANVQAAERNARINHHGRKDLRYWLAYAGFAVQNLIVRLLPRTSAEAVRSDIIAHADIQKFDGSLKMVIACTPESRHNLVDYFESRRKEGAIVYGIHIADRALMTCFLQSATSHIHFIDTANGGYALAAKQLKQQLKELQ